MTDTSGEINLQSKQGIICHLVKVEPATSAHYVADAIPFLAYKTKQDKTRQLYLTRVAQSAARLVSLGESNASIKPKNVFHAQ